MSAALQAASPLARARPWILTLLCCLASAAGAHQSSDSYLSLVAGENRITGHWDISLRDLDAALSLDANGDGLLTWGEVRQRAVQISDYALHSLKVQAGGTTCALSVSRQLVDEHSDGHYLVLELAAACPGASHALHVDYRLFAEVDAGHHGLLDLSLAGAAHTAVLGRDSPRADFDGRSAGRWQGFRDYLNTGIEHIWHGYDHILFLLSLLLPAVLLCRGRAWEPQPALRPAFVEVCKVVTAFSAAHSVTLSLATLGIVQLPARVSESAIALSIVLAALNNVFPIVQARRWIVAFAFGLLHGFGFASVLTDLGLPANTLALALVGFNFGVEVGQLAIVCALLPAAYLLRHTRVYRHVVVAGGSLCIALAGSLWLVERAFNMKFLPVH